MALRPKSIARIGIIAALYAAGTWALAPISYGPVQFRVSEALKPIALFWPGYAVAFMIGNFAANLMSPFGPWDWGVMALWDGMAAWSCWLVGKRSCLAGVVVQAVMISGGVSVFPLYFGGGVPIWLSLPPVLFSEIIILVMGYLLIWKRKDLRAMASS
jgi:uncharacterized membrane protein